MKMTGEIFSAHLTVEHVNGFLEATFEEAWACFEVYRRWNYSADDIFVIMKRFPAPHVCVTLMAPGTRDPLYDLYAGKLVSSENTFTAGWKAFGAKLNAGGFSQEQLGKMWRKSRVFSASVPVSASMTLAGLRVQEEKK